MGHIPFINPEFPTADELAQDFTAIVERNYYTNSGPLEKELASRMAAFIGRETEVSLVSNATVGLILAIKAAMLPAKKKVLIQSFTFAAGAEAIMWSGYEPVFLDIDENWQTSLNAAKEYVAKHLDDVAGVLLCNTFGVGNAQVADWEKFVRANKLPLVIDSAAGFGSQYRGGEILGARGDCEVFSLHATKPFAVGEGGAVSSQRPDIIRAINALKNFGFNNNREAESLGLNGKLPELTCAIGLRQLEKLGNRIAARRANLRHFKGLLDSSRLVFQPQDEVSTVPFISVILPDGADRQKIMLEYAKQGIEVRAYYNPPLHKQALFANFEIVGELEMTGNLAERIISLPISERMSMVDLRRIAGFLRS